VSLGGVDVAAAQVRLSQPQQRSAQLAGQAGVGEQDVFELPPHAAVQLARVEVLVGRHLGHGEAVGGGGDCDLVEGGAHDGHRDLVPFDLPSHGEEDLVDHVRLGRLGGKVHHHGVLTVCHGTQGLFKPVGDVGVSSHHDLDGASAGRQVRGQVLLPEKVRVGAGAHRPTPEHRGCWPHAGGHERSVKEIPQ